MSLPGVLPCPQGLGGGLPQTGSPLAGEEKEQQCLQQVGWDTCSCGVSRKEQISNPSSGWTGPNNLNKASLCYCKEQIFICMWHFGSQACKLEGFLSCFWSFIQLPIAGKKRDPSLG